MGNSSSSKEGSAPQAQAQPPQDAFEPMKKASTFDERHLASRGDDARFVPLTKKSYTVVGYDADREYSVTVPLKYDADDVLYRRFFNLRPDPSRAMEKIPSLAGMVFDDVEGGATKPALNKGVIVVDTFSTGALLAHHVIQEGYNCVCVLSFKNDKLLEMIPKGLDLSFDATITFDESLNEVNPNAALNDLVEQLRKLPYPIEAVMAGAETGVELADRLSEALGVRTNGAVGTEARRNKYLMGEKVREAGIRAVRQKSASRWAEVEAFLNDWQPNPYRVIVKPMESAGSDDVTLCTSFGEVREAFSRILGKVNGLGQINEGVLVQEYLEGTEYVIDTVSRDGVHKVVAIWEYDRRARNGAGFVLHGQRLMMADEERAQEMVQYQMKVLNALGINNGAGHGEVKYCNGEPVLVEVGSRCHGAEGLWCSIADKVYGYNQCRLCLDAFVDGDKFAAIPAQPTKRLGYGRMKFMLSDTSGVLKEWNPAALAEIQGMASFQGMEQFKNAGDIIKPTIDCFTWGGLIKMFHESDDVLSADYKRIEDMESSNELFILEPDVEVEVLAKKDAVIVVDPFSTGAIVASNITKAGFECICVYSEDLSAIAKLANMVPQGIELQFSAVVASGKKGPEQVEDIVQKLQAGAGARSPNIVAVLPGAETGVLLADRLSEKLGVRTNGSEGTEARRNKYLMGEKVRAAGVRAVRQKFTRSWDEAEAFVTAWQPSPFKVIVKPMESAGSEDVTLCLSLDELKVAFHRILGKVNGLGQVNEDVLIQEYLEGTEYVIDTVSRDGEHKVVGIWEYDRRPRNGAGFVCHGQKLLMPDESELVKHLISYEFSVLDALGIKNGAGHGEVKFCNGEPVLVEVGSRCHGAEGLWCVLADNVYGYNQAEVVVDAYVNESAFSSIPTQPSKRLGFGMMKFLMSNVEGKLKCWNQEVLDEITKMPSFQGMELFLNAGDSVHPTIDCFTWGGVVKLSHADNATATTDYQRLEEMENGDALLMLE